jgi:hypothetical protein
VSNQEKPKKNYIRYTPEELAAIPSPYQMEQALEKVCEAFGLGHSPFMDTEREYQLLKALGPAGYAAQRRLEDARRHHHHHR